MFNCEMTKLGAGFQSVSLRLWIGRLYFLGFPFWIELQSSYIDQNRRIYAISTVTHTRWPGNNGR